MLIETVRFIAFICLTTQQVTSVLFKTINGRISDLYYKDNIRVRRSNLESCFEYFCSGKTNCVVLRNSDTRDCFKASYSAQVLDWVAGEDLHEMFKFYLRKIIDAPVLEDKKWNIAYSGNNLLAKKPLFLWLLDEVARFATYSSLWKIHDYYGNPDLCYIYLKYNKNATGPRPDVSVLYAEPVAKGYDVVRCFAHIDDLFDFNKPFTFAMWIKTKDINKTMDLIHSWPSGIRWSLHNSTHRNQMSYCFFNDQYLDCAMTVTNNTNVNEWRHVAMVKANLSAIKFYLEGYEMELMTQIKNPKPFETEAFKKDILSAKKARQLWLWLYPFLDHLQFEGVTACVTVFQDTLSEAEIRYLRSVCP